jgi:hypothetical protein
MDGGYIEDPETDPTAVVEFSFFVPGVTQGNVDSDNDLKELLLEEGKRHNQETIIYRDYGSRAVQMLECKTGSAGMSFNDISFSNIEQFWSGLRRKRTRGKFKFV